ncbi:DNA polymerase Y family protein [Acetobacteraceae bacterium KSS12]|uniref:DNA-directed DNA polymerase n=1 Tax=Rhizosaccharibacter radicis TaxID=2782605 RepID=A0ABT1VYE2_9PROT|nr:DNA polymerase Y family protein [Acetobacteraceae bacterium KSS12]
MAQAGGKRLVEATCQLARRAGLQPGITVALAQASLPGLRCYPADPGRDVAALRELAAWCGRFTPSTRALPPDGIWLDLTGCAGLFGGEPALLDELHRGLAAEGHAGRIAVAPTPGAAWAMAHHGDQAIARVSMAGLSGCLSPLPVEALRLSEPDLVTLHRFGLHRIADLAALPRGALTRRLGMQPLRRLDQATGRIAEPIEPEPPPSSLEERRVFAEPIGTPDSLRAAIAILVDALCRRLEAGQSGVRRTMLGFGRVDDSWTWLAASLSRPSRDAAHLTRLLGERLEQVDPGEGVERMRLVALVVETLRAAQERLPQATSREIGPGGIGGREIVPRNIVHGNGPSGNVPQGGIEEAARELSALIDTLENRLGAGRLWRAHPMESDVPERSVRRVPPLDPGGNRNNAARLTAGPDPAGASPPVNAAPVNAVDWRRHSWQADGGWPSMLPRPVRLFDPPQPVQVMSELPDHPPLFFVWRRHRHQVRRAAGPERISGEWWRRDGEVHAMRDYFRIEDEHGCRFWLFRRGDGCDPATGRMDWFLHGLF